jgi:putative membrane protein
MSPRPVPGFLWFLLATLVLILLWSGIGPKDRATWWLEVAPVLVGIPILAATFR